MPELLAEGLLDALQGQDSIEAEAAMRDVAEVLILHRMSLTKKE